LNAENPAFFLFRSMYNSASTRENTGFSAFIFKFTVGEVANLGDFIFKMTPFILQI